MVGGWFVVLLGDRLAQQKPKDVRSPATGLRPGPDAPRWSGSGVLGFALVPLPNRVGGPRREARRASPPGSGSEPRDGSRRIPPRSVTTTGFDGTVRTRASTPPGAAGPERLSSCGRQGAQAPRHSLDRPHGHKPPIQPSTRSASSRLVSAGSFQEPSSRPRRLQLLQAGCRVAPGPWLQAPIVPAVGCAGAPPASGGGVSTSFTQAAARRVPAGGESTGSEPPSKAGRCTERRGRPNKGLLLAR